MKFVKSSIEISANALPWKAARVLAFDSPLVTSTRALAISSAVGTAGGFLVSAPLPLAPLDFFLVEESLVTTVFFQHN